MAIAQNPESTDWVTKLNKLYIEIVALEFGVDPTLFSNQIQQSGKIDDWATEYEKYRKLRPVITIDKKTKELTVKGLPGLK